MAPVASVIFGRECEHFLPGVTCFEAIAEADFPGVGGLAQEREALLLVRHHQQMSIDGGQKLLVLAGGTQASAQALRGEHIAGA